MRSITVRFTKPRFLLIKTYAVGETLQLEESIGRRLINERSAVEVKPGEAPAPVQANSPVETADASADAETATRPSHKRK